MGSTGPLPVPVTAAPQRTGNGRPGAIMPEDGHSTDFRTYTLGAADMTRHSTRSTTRSAGTEERASKQARMTFGVIAAGSWAARLASEQS